MGKISNQVFVVEMRTDKTTFDEWLKEHDREVRNKVIDDFIEELEEHEQLNWIDNQEYGITWDDINTVAEKVNQQ